MAPLSATIAAVQLSRRRRLGAALVDFALLAYLSVPAVLTFFFAALDQIGGFGMFDASKGGDPVLLQHAGRWATGAVKFALGWACLQGIVIAAHGSSIGKSLFSITSETENGQKPSRWRVLLREEPRHLLGLGIMIAHWRLTRFPIGDDRQQSALVATLGGSLLMVALAAHLFLDGWWAIVGGRSLADRIAGTRLSLDRAW
jgi:hypothetical protein